MVDIQVKVVAAFFVSGALNAGTPFAIASVPLIATLPAANACRSMNSVTGSMPSTWSGGVLGVLVPFKMIRRVPSTMMLAKLKMKR